MVFCQKTVMGLFLFHVQDEASMAAWQSGEYYVDGTPKSSLPAIAAAAATVHRGIVASCPGLLLTPKLVVKASKPTKIGHEDQAHMLTRLHLHRLARSAAPHRHGPRPRRDDGRLQGRAGAGPARRHRARVGPRERRAARVGSALVLLALSATLAACGAAKQRAHGRRGRRRGQVGAERAAADAARGRTPA